MGFTYTILRWIEYQSELNDVLGKRGYASIRTSVLDIQLCLQNIQRSTQALPHTALTLGLEAGLE